MRSIPLDPERLELRGALEVDVSDAGLHPRRLPSWAWPRMAGPFLPIVVPMGSGVRLVLSTDADAIELDAKLRTFMFAGDPYRELRFDLVVDGDEVATADAPEADALVLDRSDPRNTILEERGVTTVRFGGLRARGSGERSTVEIWFPQAAEIELRGLRVDDGAVVERAPVATGPRWVHYGSSISHCMEADRPLGVWPVVAARRLGWDLVNLGFAGSCHLDPFVARTIRDLPLDRLTMKVGINVVNHDAMRERTFGPALHGFLDTVRDGHPETPIAVISPILCPPLEDHPGPTAKGPDGQWYGVARTPEESAGCLSVGRIREIVESVVAVRRDLGDANLRYVDGRQLFGPDDAPDLPDSLHPSPAGYRRMGERFAALAGSGALG